MATLIVKPLDMAAPGSYKARRRIRAALRTSRDAVGRSDEIRGQLKALQDVAEPTPEQRAALDALEREMLAISADATDAVEDLEALVIAQARTDDGTPVEDVLELISADDFDKLLQALLGESSVPTMSSGG